MLKIKMEFIITPKMMKAFPCLNRYEKIVICQPVALVHESGYLKEYLPDKDQAKALQSIMRGKKIKYDRFWTNIQGGCDDPWGWCSEAATLRRDGVLVWASKYACHDLVCLVGNQGTVF